MEKFTHPEPFLTKAISLSKYFLRILSPFLRILNIFSSETHGMSLAGKGRAGGGGMLVARSGRGIIEQGRTDTVDDRRRGGEDRGTPDPIV